MDSTPDLWADRLEPGRLLSLARESRYFQSIVDFAVDAFLVLDPNGRPVYFNSAFVALWAIPDELAEVADERLVAHVASRLSNPQAFFSRINADPDTYDQAGERLYLKDENVFHSVAWPLIDGSSVVGQVWNFRNITDRLAESARARQALAESESRFRSLVENASDLITVVKADATIVYQSPSSLRLLGYDADQLIGSKLTNLVHPDDHRMVLLLLAQAAGRASQATQVDVRLRDSQGRWHYVEISVTDRQDDRGVAGLVLNTRDVTARHTLEAELIFQANHDPLTTLLNRRGFIAELEINLSEILPEGRSMGALLLFDLDDFKDVNDSLGHQAGDQVLADLAALLRAELGETATIGRLGGDEFAVLLQGITMAQAGLAGRRLLTAIRGHTFEIAGGETMDLTASLGLVAFPRDGSTVVELMSRVDLALYEAKAQGRNRASGFARLRNLEAKAEARLKLRHEIRGAMKEDRLLLYSQPILDLRSGTVSHHEMLLRMKQRNGHILAAKSFIGLAERSGLIIPIDFWVIRQAISLLAAQVPSGGDQVLAVNLSAKAFVDRELLEMIEERLKKDCPDPSRLVIEVTETAAIADIENAERFMRRLKGMGCRFALDDFGVGFSSLQRLRRLPVDYLKIDGSFIRAITRSAEDQALVRSFVTVAGALDMETIAEFVETKEQLKLIQELGVDFAQGNFVGPPRNFAGNSRWPSSAIARAA